MWMLRAVMVAAVVLLHMPSASAGSGGERVSLGDAQSSPKPERPQAESGIRAKLEREGYSQVSHLKQDKDGWMATAVKDGKQVILDIDNEGNIVVTK